MTMLLHVCCSAFYTLEQSYQHKTCSSISTVQLLYHLCDSAAASSTMNTEEPVSQPMYFATNQTVYQTVDSTNPSPCGKVIGNAGNQD